MLLDLWGLFRRVVAAGKPKDDDRILVKIDGTSKRLTLDELKDLLDSLESREEKRLIRIRKTGVVKHVQVVSAPEPVTVEAHRIVQEANDHFREIARKVREMLDDEEITLIIGAT